FADRFRIGEGSVGEVSLQLAEEFQAGGWSLFGIDTHGPANQPLDLGTQLRGELARRSQILAELLLEDAHRSAGVEGEFAGDGHVEGGPQRIDVAAGVRVLGVVELLRS